MKCLERGMERPRPGGYGMMAWPGRSMTPHDGQHPASTDHTVPSGTDHFPDFPGISCLATFMRSLWDNKARNGRFTQAQIPNSGPRRPGGPTVEPQTGPGTVRSLTR
jgi:hypothetical protein